MKIHNIRLGLATNSSSTHSIIIMRPEDYAKTKTNECHDFGWNYFTAADRNSKVDYLGYILQNSLIDLIGESNANVVVDSLFEGECAWPISMELRKGYGIDHQSMVILPANWDGKGANLEFFKDLKDYILENPIAILGGNDNGDDEHPLRNMGRSIDLGLPKDGRAYPSLIARKDEVNGNAHWVVFNRESGAKVCLTFGKYPKGKASVAIHQFLQGPSQQKVAKAETPELVDVKITDFCPAGCKFCYQASTPSGEHAKLNLIHSIGFVLRNLHVFEVAIGGGEPTMHPDFLGILRYFHNYGIIPNFSTRRLTWLFEKDYKDIIKSCGSFAYSVSTGADVKGFATAVEKRGLDELLPDQKVSVQYVLNSGGNLYDVLEEARKGGFRVTLLGFKKAGFGKDFKQVPEDWISTVKRVRKESSWVTIGVDTAVVKESKQDIIRELGVAEELMTGEEGKFSMYIDAVNGTMGPSSYCSPDEMEPIIRGQGKTTEDYIRERFIRW